MFDPVGRAKYDAWKKMKGTSRQNAQQAYVDLVEKLQNK
jgi:acyl-CoA-binding protein